MVLFMGTVSIDAAHAQSVTHGQPIPFTIDVPDTELRDLDERLARTRWPEQIPGSAWTYGTDTAYLRELVGYWQNGFDWRAQERRLNAFPHYRAEVEGLRIHFIHARSENPDAIPLLLLHGWPSSFVQMLDIIPLLTAPTGDTGPSFHVVVASLPGYGFSDIPAEPGVGFARIAELLATLMTDVLGYSRYGLRGSDLGGVISQQIALRHPERVIGVHLTGIIGANLPYTAELTEAEAAFVAATTALNQSELAYARLHMTKPQTLGHALNDSPAGLASWIVEKFRSWGDTGGVIESRFSKDELLTNLMVYWTTGTINSSMRLYYEFVREPARTARITVPVGMLMSTKDLFPAAPRKWGERLFNVVRWSETDSGGHFLEWEEPQLVAEDLRAFFATLVAGDAPSAF
jgi:pimeloyl-ACP methyl ester carboxylesterase